VEVVLERDDIDDSGDRETIEIALIEMARDNMTTLQNSI